MQTHEVDAAGHFSHINPDTRTGKLPPPDAKWDPCYIISQTDDSYDVMVVKDGTSIFGIPGHLIRRISASRTASPASQSPVQSPTAPKAPPSPASSGSHSLIASPGISSHSGMEAKIDKLAEFLDCVICQKLLYKPVTLPCGHNFWFVLQWSCGLSARMQLPF